MWENTGQPQIPKHGGVSVPVSPAVRLSVTSQHRFTSTRTPRCPDSMQRNMHGRSVWMQPCWIPRSTLRGAVGGQCGRRDWVAQVGGRRTTETITFMGYDRMGPCLGVMFQFRVNKTKTLLNQGIGYPASPKEANWRSRLNAPHGLTYSYVVWAVGHVVNDATRPEKTGVLACAFWEVVLKGLPPPTG